MKFLKNGGLDAVEIGKLTDTGNMELFFDNALVGSLPIKPLADSSPEYNRPSKKLKKKNERIKIFQVQK